ncbi:hypothetical protein Sjap_011564 [Stephania japonica]|uniref:Acid phosphatase n=1 Tax=Stephania japonica TaxID=461633 RepID=A0AAP0P4T9_9MAGN
MHSGEILILIPILLLSNLSLSAPTASPPISSTISPDIYLPTDLEALQFGRRDALFCDSWRLSVETNNAGEWWTIPSTCIDYVAEYMGVSGQYGSDCAVVALDAAAAARALRVVGDGLDAWVFDIDETLLSNLPYYAAHGFGSEAFDDKSFDEWAELAECPAIPASLRLYQEVQRLGFELVLLTGRYESQRNATTRNLLGAGYHGWDRLILRGPSDIRKTAMVYKSEKRMQLEEQGYRIHGSCGDQWSDLLGHPMATRSFKMPNPMYYIA